MRVLLCIALAFLCSGCPAVSAARQRDLRTKTVDLRVGMTSEELVAVLGEPSTKEGARCNIPQLSGRTCQGWRYDPADGWLVAPLNNRVLLVVLVPNNGRLFVATWVWR